MTNKNIYKVDNTVLDRIKKHLKATKRKLFSDIASTKGGTREKLAKENDALIKLIEDNYPG